MTQKPNVIVLMGVAGSGKTTVGQKLADELGWSFFDGDDFHPQANIDKMKAGEPLTDEDRWPWLEAIRHLIDQHLELGQTAVITCSALKENYRNVLLPDDSRVQLIYLSGDYKLLKKRLRRRDEEHFFGPDMLDSQFAALEPPEDALKLDVDQSPEEIVAAIRKSLSL